MTQEAPDLTMAKFLTYARHALANNPEAVLDMERVHGQRALSAGGAQIAVSMLQEFSTCAEKAKLARVALSLFAQERPYQRDYWRYLEKALQSPSAPLNGTPAELSLAWVGVFDSLCEFMHIEPLEKIQQLRERYSTDL
ncbi:hypothetical protein [Nesterenkonia rhizosphaerae]